MILLFNMILLLAVSTTVEAHNTKSDYFQKQLSIIKDDSGYTFIKDANVLAATLEDNLTELEGRIDEQEKFIHEKKVELDDQHDRCDSTLVVVEAGKVEYMMNEISKLGMVKNALMGRRLTESESESFFDEGSFEDAESEYTDFGSHTIDSVRTGGILRTLQKNLFDERVQLQEWRVLQLELDDEEDRLTYEFDKEYNRHIRNRVDLVTMNSNIISDDFDIESSNYKEFKEVYKNLADINDRLFTSTELVEVDKWYSTPGAGTVWTTEHLNVTNNSLIQWKIDYDKVAVYWEYTKSKSKPWVRLDREASLRLETMYANKEKGLVLENTAAYINITRTAYIDFNKTTDEIDGPFTATDEITIRRVSIENLSYEELYNSLYGAVEYEKKIIVKRDDFDNWLKDIKEQQRWYEDAFIHGTLVVENLRSAENVLLKNQYLTREEWRRRDRLKTSRTRRLDDGGPKKGYNTTCNSFDCNRTLEYQQRKDSEESGCRVVYEGQFGPMISAIDTMITTIEEDIATVTTVKDKCLEEMGRNEMEQKIAAASLSYLYNEQKMMIEKIRIVKDSMKYYSVFLRPDNFNLELIFPTECGDGTNPTDTTDCKKAIEFLNERCRHDCALGCTPKYLADLLRKNECTKDEQEEAQYTIGIEHLIATETFGRTQLLPTVIQTKKNLEFVKAIDVLRKKRKSVKSSNLDCNQCSNFIRSRSSFESDSINQYGQLHWYPGVVKEGAYLCLPLSRSLNEQMNLLTTNFLERQNNELTNEQKLTSDSDSEKNIKQKIDKEKNKKKMVTEMLETMQGIQNGIQNIVTLIKTTVVSDDSGFKEVVNEASTGLEFQLDVVSDIVDKTTTRITTLGTALAHKQKEKENEDNARSNMNDAFEKFVEVDRTCTGLKQDVIALKDERRGVEAQRDGEQVKMETEEKTQTRVADILKKWAGIKTDAKYNIFSAFRDMESVTSAKDIDNSSFYMFSNNNWLVSFKKLITMVMDAKYKSEDVKAKLTNERSRSVYRAALLVRMNNESITNLKKKEKEDKQDLQQIMDKRRNKEETIREATDLKTQVYDIIRKYDEGTSDLDFEFKHIHEILEYWFRGQETNQTIEKEFIKYTEQLKERNWTEWKKTHVYNVFISDEFHKVRLRFFKHYVSKPNDNSLKQKRLKYLTVGEWICSDMVALADIWKTVTGEPLCRPSEKATGDKVLDFNDIFERNVGEGDRYLEQLGKVIDDADEASSSLGKKISDLKVTIQTKKETLATLEKNQKAVEEEEVASQERWNRKDASASSAIQKFEEVLTLLTNSSFATGFTEYKDDTLDNRRLHTVQTVQDALSIIDTKLGKIRDQANEEVIHHLAEVTDANGTLVELNNTIFSRGYEVDKCNTDKEAAENHYNVRKKEYEQFQPPPTLKLRDIPPQNFESLSTYISQIMSKNALDSIAWVRETDRQWRQTNDEEMLNNAVTMAGEINRMVDTLNIETNGELSETLIFHFSKFYEKLIEFYDVLEFYDGVAGGEEWKVRTENVHDLLTIQDGLLTNIVDLEEAYPFHSRKRATFYLTELKRKSRIANFDMKNCETGSGYKYIKEQINPNIFVEALNDSTMTDYTPILAHFNLLPLKDVRDKMVRDCNHLELNAGEEVRKQAANIKEQVDDIFEDIKECGISNTDYIDDLEKTSFEYYKKTLEPKKEEVKDFIDIITNSIKLLKEHLLKEPSYKAHLDWITSALEKLAIKKDYLKMQLAVLRVANFPDFKDANLCSQLLSWHSLLSKKDFEKKKDEMRERFVVDSGLVFTKPLQFTTMEAIMINAANTGEDLDEQVLDELNGGYLGSSTTGKYKEIVSTHIEKLLANLSKATDIYKSHQLKYIDAVAVVPTGKVAEKLDAFFVEPVNVLVVGAYMGADNGVMTGVAPETLGAVEWPYIEYWFRDKLKFEKSHEVRRYEGYVQAASTIRFDDDGSLLPVDEYEWVDLCLIESECLENLKDQYAIAVTARFKLEQSEFLYVAAKKKLRDFQDAVILGVNELGESLEKYLKNIGDSIDCIPKSKLINVTMNIQKLRLNKAGDACEAKINDIFEGVGDGMEAIEIYDNYLKTSKANVTAAHAKLTTVVTDLQDASNKRREKIDSYEDDEFDWKKLNVWFDKKGKCFSNRPESLNLGVPSQCQRPVSCWAGEKLTDGLNCDDTMRNHYDILAEKLRTEAANIEESQRQVATGLKQRLVCDLNLPTKSPFGFRFSPFLSDHDGVHI